MCPYGASITPRRQAASRSPASASAFSSSRSAASRSKCGCIGLLPSRLFPGGRDGEVDEVLGPSFRFAKRFVDPALAFAQGAPLHHFAVDDRNADVLAVHGFRRGDLDALSLVFEFASVAQCGSLYLQCEVAMQSLTVRGLCERPGCAGRRPRPLKIETAEMSGLIDPLPAE